MIKNYMFLLFIFFSIGLSQFTSFNIGTSKSNGVYDAYNGTGTHYKLNFHREIDNDSITDIYLNYGVQYIYFGSNIVSSDSWSGLVLKEAEQGTMFDVGLKKYWSSKTDDFRLYVGGSVGFAFMKEYEIHDYPDTYDPCENNNLFQVDSILDFFFWLLDRDDPCEPGWDDNKIYKTKDRLSSPYFSLDIGANFYLNKQKTWMLDIGVNYNAMSKIEKNQYGDNVNEGVDLYNQNNSIEILENIGRSINADYQTFYIGISTPF